MAYGEMSYGGCGCGCHQQNKSNHKDPFLAKNYNNVLLKKDAKPSKKIPPKTKPKKKATHTMPDGTVMSGKKHSKSSKAY